MARITWTSGDKGIDWAAVDSDAYSHKATLQDIGELAALVQDVATGANSPPITLDFAGTGLGACPEFPIGQFMRPAVRGAYNATLDEDVYLAIVPIHLPAGQTEITVELDNAPTSRGSLRCQVLSASDMSIVAETFNISFPNQSNQPGVARFHGLAGDAEYLVAWRVRAYGGETYTVGGMRVVTARTPRQTGGAPTSGVGNPISLNTQAGASGATIADLKDIDQHWLAEDRALSSLVLDRIARNLATLDEMITGRPSHGANSSHTLAPSTGDSNPADDPFLCGSRSVYASEPVFAVPLGFWVGGPVTVASGGGSGNKPGTVYAPGAINNVATHHTGAEILVNIPDMATGISLRVQFLWQSDGSTFNLATVNASVNSYDAAGSLTGTYTQASTSWTNLADDWWLAEVTVGFAQDQLNRLGCGYTVTAGNLKGSGGDLRLAGVNVYLKKT